MSTNHRRGKAPCYADCTNRLNALKSKGETDNKQGFSALKYRKKDKHVANRCCYVCPDQRDFGQSYNKRVIKDITDDYTGSILAQQYGLEPAPVSLNQMKETKKVSYRNRLKCENGSQYINSPPAYVETSDGTQWQNVNTVEDVDKMYTIQDDPPYMYERLPKNTFISDVPHVKIIAEKFSKYKRDNLEIRRLDEKVVCVEYDIYQSCNKDIMRPMQSMRAYFCIKPVSDGAYLPRLSSNIKNKLDIKDEDIKNLTENEIEIIDDKIEANKSYLEDLMRILKRHKVIANKKNKSSLDLNSLYEMAKKDRSALDCEYSEANLLSKAELKQVKDMILQRSMSSIHGIRRTRVKSKLGGTESTVEAGLISESIVAELLRDDVQLSVFE